MFAGFRFAVREAAECLCPGVTGENIFMALEQSAIQRSMWPTAFTFREVVDYFAAS